MRVLVTGFAGYIGPVVVAALKRAGHIVSGLDTMWFLPNYVEPALWPVLIVEGDLREDWTMNGGADAVVHLAGLSNDPLGELHPNLTNRINYQGTIDLMRALPDIRHVFISSCSVYGANEMATEASVTNPLTAYARSKADVDEWLHGPHRVGNIGVARWDRNAISLRLGTVYGYSPGHRTDLVVNAMVYDAILGKPIIATGNPSRPLVHVEDVASAILWAVEGKERGIANVVGENWRIRDLAEHISSYTGADIIYREAGADARDYMADGSLLRSQGWEPRHTVEGSLPVLAEKSIALPPGEYTRLGAIKSLIERGILTPQLTRKA